MRPLKAGAIFLIFVAVVNSSPVAQGDNEEVNDDADDNDGWVVIGCNEPSNSTIQLSKAKQTVYGWTPSKANIISEGRDYENWSIEAYPAGTECTLTLGVPAGETLDIYFEALNTKGEMEQGCEGGDYLQVTIDGAAKSHKACGTVHDLGQDWEWDWATEAFRIPPDATKDRTIEVKFVSPEGGNGGLLFDEEIPAEGFLLGFYIGEPFPYLPMLE